MRLFIVLLAIIFAAFGALFGALNSERFALDFYFAQIQFPKGASLLLALLIGWLLGGLLVYVSLVPGLRRRLRAQARELHRVNLQHMAKVDPTGASTIVQQASDA